MSEETKPTKNYSNIVTPKQFILYSIGSFGLFDAIRAYRNRKHFKKVEWTKIMPFWRAVFMPLRAVELFKKIQEYSSKEWYEWKFSPMNHGIGYMAMSIAGRISSWSIVTETIGLIVWIFAFRPLLKPLEAANYYYQQIEKNAIERPMQRRHYLLTILYVIFWWLAIWGIIEMIVYPEIVAQP